MPLVDWEPTYATWQDKPSRLTAIKALALNNLQAGVLAIRDALNTLVQPKIVTDGASTGDVATLQSDGSFAAEPMTGGIFDLDPGYLIATGVNGDYAASQAAICSVTGPIDVRWFGSGMSIAGTGAFRSIVNVAGAFDFRQLSSSGKLAINAQNGAASQVGNVGGATIPIGNGYRAIYDPTTGAASIEVLDPAGSIATSDGHGGIEHWTLIASFTVPALTGGQLTPGLKRVGVCGLTTNGTEGNALHTTAVQIFDGIDGTLVVDVDFTGRNQLAGTIQDTAHNVWQLYGNAYFQPVSGKLTKGGATLSLASIVDMAKTAGGWGSAARNPVTGGFHPENFGPVDVDPVAWTVAQRGAAIRSARAAAAASVDLANKRGAAVFYGVGVYEVDPDISLPDPYTGQPHCAIKTWDYVAHVGCGWDVTTIKLTNGANCHVFGHPGRLQASGQQDQIFNASWRYMTIDGNKAGQDGSHTHDGLRISQHSGLRIEGVHFLNIDGKPYYSTATGDFYAAPATKPGVNIVRPISITDSIAEGCAQGWFMSAANRDAVYKNVGATGCGTPQARLAGKTLAANIAAPGGQLSLLIDANPQVNIALATGDTPASVVTKINAALGATTAIAADCTISRYRTTITDAQFNGTTNMYSPSGPFLPADANQLVIGDNTTCQIPRGTKIAAYVDAHNVTLSNPIPAAGGAGVLVNVEIGTNVIASPFAVAGWNGGKATGAGIPAGAIVAAAGSGTFTIVDAGGLPLTPKVIAANSTGIVTVNGKGRASLTPNGRLLISSDTTGGIGQVFIVGGSSTPLVLTNLGLTTAPANGDNNYRVGACEFPGFYFDHSERMATGCWADSNYGDGFYIHNVNACVDIALHSTRNSGYGIYVDAWCHSTGVAWVAMMNCPDFGVASYRATATETAECYFDNGTEGYGITQDSVLDGFNGPGAMSTIGNDFDNRFAKWAVYVADNIKLTVDNDVPAATSLLIKGIRPGDGGLSGVLRTPAAYKPTAVLPLTPTTKTANYVAVRGDMVLADTSGGTFVITIPPAAAGVGQIGVKWVKGAVPPIISVSGADHFNTATGGTTATPILLNQGYLLVSDASSVWIIAADDLPFSALQTQFDSRYAVLASPAFTGNPTAPTPPSGDNTTSLATTAFVQAAVTGLLDFRGNFDASANAFPTTGGSGAAGAILKADFWVVSVAGTLGGTVVAPGDWLAAKVDTPGSTAGNWTIVEHDLGYTPAAVTRQIATGTGLLGGGDLSADRTLTPDFGTGAGKVTQGNDPRLSDARTPNAHAASHTAGGSDQITVTEAQVTGLLADLAAKLAATTTLDAILNPTAARAMNAQKITGLANGTADTDAQAFGQRPFDAGRLSAAVTVSNVSGAQQLWAATTIPAAKLAVGSTFFYTVTGTLDNQATSGAFTFLTKVNGSAANSSAMPSQTGAASGVFWSLVVYVTVIATGVGGSVNVTGLLTLPTAAAGTQGQKIIGNVQAVDLSAGLTIRADINMATASATNVVRAQAGCCAQSNMP